MESREKVKTTIREILQNHGIQDKDKLESLPEALTSYYGGCLVNTLMDLNGELTVKDIESFMSRNWETDGSEKT